MKTALFSILIIVILLVGGFIYVQSGGSVSNSLRSLVTSGSPTVTTGQSDATKLIFKNYGLAPEFGTNNIKWLNSDPQTIADLRGKVVLINFWTYSCINCIHTLPYLNDWADIYQKQGLVVIGVHTPQYAFEKVTESVQETIQRYNINYPIIQDNNYALWNAYNNQFWPAIYLIDREGKIVYTHFGEGKYELLANAVRTLTGLPSGVALSEDKAAQISPATFQKLAFGLKHIESLQSNEPATPQEQVYTLPEVLRRNAYALEGIWKLSDEKAALTQGYGRIKLSFNAAKIQLTAQSIKPVNLKIKIDGKQQDSVSVQTLQNYQLFSAEKSEVHTLEIEVPQPGFEVTSFIFD